MTDYIWTPSGTDITERWRRIGWVPPSELSSYQQKWSSYRELPLRELGLEQLDGKSVTSSSNVINYPYKK